MGWTFSYKPETREQALERICPAAGWTYQDQRVTFSREHWTPEGCWGILQATNPDNTPAVRLIAFARVARHGGPGYGEGGLWPETAGPYEPGCPKRLLQTPPIYGREYSPQSVQWAQDFRARVAGTDTQTPSLFAPAQESSR